jgi:hypothetical protein
MLSFNEAVLNGWPIVEKQHDDERDQCQEKPPGQRPNKPSDSL